MQRCLRLTTAIAASTLISLTSVAAQPSVGAQRAGPRIRFLHRTESAGVLTRLADEVRIYTSDLAGEVVIDGAVTDAVPSTPTDAAVVLIWLERDGAASGLQVLRGGDGKRLRLPLPRSDSAADLTTAALKVRAFVAETRLSTGRLASHDAAVEASAVLPAPVPLEPAPPPKPERQPEPEVPPKAAAPPEIPAIPEVAPVVTPPAALQPRFEVQLLGSAAHPFGPGQPAIEVTLRGFWWHGRLGIGAEASLCRGFDVERIDGSNLHFSDLPFGVEGVLRTRLGPFEVAAGPRLRLHLIETRVRKLVPREELSEARPAAGLGVLLLARWAFTTHFAVVASASGEAIVPRWDFVLDDTAETNVPSGLVAIGVGLSWTGP